MREFGRGAGKDSCKQQHTLHCVWECPLPTHMYFAGSRGHTLTGALSLFTPCTRKCGLWRVCARPVARFGAAPFTSHIVVFDWLNNCTIRTQYEPNKSRE